VVDRGGHALEAIQAARAELDLEHRRARVVADAGEHLRLDRDAFHGVMIATRAASASACRAQASFETPSGCGVSPRPARERAVCSFPRAGIKLDTRPSPVGGMPL